MDAARCQQQSASHSYTTRIRQNISIKPAPRLRHSPDPTPSTSTSTIHNDSNGTQVGPRKQHSVTPCRPEDIPEFPPPHVILHKDDSGSKVFLALARSLLSVDNRATTVKDLADLAVHNGLGCQNSSAATQAITTYLRLHNERCEADHDQPLLLSHNMSGTDADDDLIPALYSLQGGNPRKLSPNRQTNFRKNTAVWYLSRATGAPCPFARAGIRLCDYDDFNEEEHERESKRRRLKHQIVPPAGHKRKRPLRSCVAKGASDTESEHEEDARPQKKLTLRIKINTAFTNRASASQPPVDSENSSDDSSAEEYEEEPMAVDQSDPEPEPEESKNEEEEEWRLPPYPRRSISIPCYTPSYEGSYPQFPLYADDFRRSPSVGSPPPESEDEANDFHISMTRTTLPDYSSEDSESEGETQFESPGPRSPSAPFIPASASITVKEEPRDLQSMLDAWDDIDSGLMEPNVVQVEPHPLVFKSEPSDVWDWDSEPTTRIKQEDLSFDSLFPSSSPLSTPSLSSTSRLTPDPFLSSSSSTSDELDASVHLFPSRASTVRVRSNTVPVISSQQQTPTPIASSSSSVPPPPALSTRNNSISGTSPESATIQPFFSADIPPSITTLIQSMNSLCTSAVPPSSLLLNPISSSSANAVVVHTCPPCSPPISATQIEDISVYQMVLGSFHFLRRIDTDFVNLSPIVAYTRSPLPVITTIPNATVVAKGSHSVSGVWIPLPAAQAYIKDHPAKDGEFDQFLSHRLHERFPSALQDFVKSNASARALNQFGRDFTSTLQASQQPLPPVPLSAAEMLARQPPQLQLQQLQSMMNLHSPASDVFSLSAALSIAERQHDELAEPPLSATEQEIFELCVVPDWEKESGPGLSEAPDGEPRGSIGDVEMKEEEQEEDDGGDVSDTSSLTSLESSPDVSLMKEEEPAASCSVPPPPPQETRTSCAVSLSAGDEGGGKNAMEEDNSTVAPLGKRKGGSTRGERVLRRSKRVADLSAQPVTSTSNSSVNTRSRRRGSRNSLS
ncbi:hypothetical protein FA15DRAFT_615866 [Coprinopsis marcescibilis]|uniref:HTH APSES-type domain-containing protein n=1 Tax=Coprinopsis marcescibilis TaxID=230819 RepID=A0A5C3L152_COPMA|nr:hypothetical protein FA15DRAFT_615866 [Coprinopsis marcescibilis]